MLDAFATKRDKETFLSGATSDAGAWMDAAGTYASRTNMEDRDYKTAAQLRLQTIGFHGYCAECSNVSSGRLVPHDLHHSLTCRRLAGHRNKRHNVVRDTLAQLAAPIEGVEIVTEPVVHAGLGYARKEGCDTDEHGHDIDHRGDVWIKAQDKKSKETISWLVDVTVHHAPASNSTAAAPAEPGSTAETAAAGKVADYTRNYVIPSETVVPVAFETGGRINDSAGAFLKHLAWMLFRSQKAGVPKPRAYFRRMLGERLSVSLQRGNARMIDIYRKAGGARVKSSYRWDLTSTEVAKAREVEQGWAAGGPVGAGAAVGAAAVGE